MAFDGMVVACASLLVSRIVPVLPDRAEKIIALISLSWYKISTGEFVQSG